MYQFKQNKYSKWYFNIIKEAQKRKLLGYSEKHHILPRCLGGNDNPLNLGWQRKETQKKQPKKHFEIVTDEFIVCYIKLTHFAKDFHLNRSTLSAKISRNEFPFKNIQTIKRILLP